MGRFSSVGLPSAALQFRESAHFKEINNKYSQMMAFEMAKEVDAIYTEIKSLSRREALMKYAHPSYTYQPMKNID